jgi:hypothetical protein
MYKRLNIFIVNNSTINQLRPLEPTYTLIVPVEEELQPGIFITGKTNLFNAIGVALFDTLQSGYLKDVKSEKFTTAFGDSDQWNIAANYIAEYRDEIVTKDYLSTNYISSASGRGYGDFIFDNITANRFSTEDGNSDLWNETAAFVQQNSTLNVSTYNASHTFTDLDTNKVHHFNTPFNSSLSATIPSDISNGFNVAILNTGTGTLQVIATNLASTGTVITQRYSGAFIYKDSDVVYAVGNLEA